MNKAIPEHSLHVPPHSLCIYCCLCQKKSPTSLGALVSLLQVLTEVAFPVTLFICLPLLL